MISSETQTPAKKKKRLRSTDLNQELIFEFLFQHSRHHRDFTGRTNEITVTTTTATTTIGSIIDDTYNDVNESASVLSIEQSIKRSKFEIIKFNIYKIKMLKWPSVSILNGKAQYISLEILNQ